MTDSHSPRLLTVLLISAFAAVMGCDARIEQFEPNRVFSLDARQVSFDSHRVGIGGCRSNPRVLFGTPNEPRWPEELFEGSDAEGLVDLEILRRAAGPVSSGKDGTHQGLFREHCVVCHALEGSGAGPASQFQDPYPRDFRHGVFKWKSTIRGAKPTKQDLLDLLTRGVPGTGMPSLLSAEPGRLGCLGRLRHLPLGSRRNGTSACLVGAMDELDYGDIGS